MARLAQKKRSGKDGSGGDSPHKTAHRQTDDKKLDAKRKTMRSAYLQTKMAVSSPGDQQEQEADRVADEVSRMPKGVARQVDDTVPPGSSKPENTAEQPQSLQTKISRAKDDETAQPKLHRQADEEAQTKAFRAAEDEQAQTKLHREEDPLQKKLARQEVEEANPSAMRTEEDIQTKLQRDTDEDLESASDTTDSTTETQQGSDAPIISDETEQKIDSMRGQGSPLADDVRQEMEEKMNANFSQVSIHNNAEADALCKQISARAFTVGNDIFFAAGEYAPSTEAGKKLLAHELTHVIQQSQGVQTVHRSIDPADTPAGNATAQEKLTALSTLDIPTTKQRHLPIYSSLSQRGLLKRIKSYRRPSRGPERPNQIRIWKNAINVTESEIIAKLAAGTGGTPVTLPVDNNNPVNFTLADGSEHSPRKREFLNDLVKIPTWSQQGNETSYQVDHIVELQVSGEEGLESSIGNTIQNMELFDASSNTTSGNEIMNGIRVKATEYFNSLTDDEKGSFTRYRSWLGAHDIIFDGGVRTVAGAVAESASSSWSLGDIQALEHLNALRGVRPAPIEGTPTSFVLGSGPGGMPIAQFAHERNETTIRATGSARRRIAGLTISEINLTPSSELNHAEGATNRIGTVTAEWNLPQTATNTWQPETPGVSIPIYGLGPHSGYLIIGDPLTVHFAHASPVLFNDLYIGTQGLTADGSLTPSLSMLEGLDISVQMADGDIIFRAEYTADNLNLEFPGITIDSGSIGLTYGAEQGFGVDGSIDLSVENLGDGSITAGFNQRDGFFAEGNFDFDSRLFDRATARVWYRDNAFGGEGTLGIDSPDKIKGIRSAEITVGFGENTFTANGRVSPNIPGVEEAGLNITYSEETGLVIGGTLALNQDTPGIRSGEVEVTLSKEDSEWKVAASGTAIPDIPGINSELTVDYNDGAFTAAISADYSRGMLSGTVNVGVTNRSIGEDGETLSDTAEPGNPLIVYGGGSLALQLAPWLRATAGVQFSPNGEITVTGEIALPDEIEIFARREINRSIFNIAVQAPIFPGIVAEIGGGLSATAGIGPGVIDQLSLGIVYNPDHEEDTTITGDAHLNIPANAGLRLSVRAGIGLGITGASATGGLDIGGTLGIEGAAEAGVHVEWTPANGLNIEANVGVHAQPSFTFDIGGYVSVRALGFSVYDERWEFASYTFGSDYRFGISLPIHYQEGEPFDISLDDVEFEVPDIDTNQLLRGLIARIA